MCCQVQFIGFLFLNSALIPMYGTLDIYLVNYIMPIPQKDILMNENRSAKTRYDILEGCKSKPRYCWPVRSNQTSRILKRPFYFKNNAFCFNEIASYLCSPLLFALLDGFKCPSCTKTVNLQTVSLHPESISTLQLIILQKQHISRALIGSFLSSIRVHTDKISIYAKSINLQLSNRHLLNQ